MMLNKNKEYPILFRFLSECCGCTACMAICPKNAIFMKENEEGFLYPEINKLLCIKCYQCISVCVFKNDQKSRGILSE